MFNLYWNALTLYIRRSIWLYCPFTSSQTFQSILLSHESRPPDNPANDFTQGVYYGLQSSLYAKASQFDRSLSRSYFKEQSDLLHLSLHNNRYRLLCQIYLLSWNGQFAKTGLSPVRLNILLAARDFHPQSVVCARHTRDLAKNCLQFLAESAGFEPAVPLRAHLISSQAPSTGLGQLSVN